MAGACLRPGFSEAENRRRIPSFGEPIKQDWSYRKAAEAAKGRKEYLKKPELPDPLPTASGLIPTCI
jgi:hypothetical protein